MNIKPLNGNIFVKLQEIDDVSSEFGIVIPDSAKKRADRGEVIAVSPNIKDERIAVGSTVLFGNFGGKLVKVDDSEYLVLTEDDIFAVLN